MKCVMYRYIGVHINIYQFYPSSKQMCCMVFISELKLGQHHSLTQIVIRVSLKILKHFVMRVAPNVDYLEKQKHHFPLLILKNSFLVLCILFIIAHFSPPSECCMKTVSLLVLPLTLPHKILITLLQMCDINIFHLTM